MTSPENLGGQFEPFKPFDPTVHGYDNSKVGMVPTHVIAKYIQQDRAKEDDYARSNIDAIKNSILKNGWNTAVSLAHDKENNWGAVIEGNHRIAAAKELGLTHVPVSVHTMGYPEDGFTRSPRVGAPLHLATTNELPRYGYVHPNNFKELSND